MPLVIGIPKETFPGEKRVATAPEVVAKLIKLGFAVAVESGAGDGASFFDDAYSAAGARIRQRGRALGGVRHRLQGARAEHGRSRADEGRHAR